MTITIKCGECGKGYKVSDEVSGKRFKCKNCGQPIHVPKKQFDSDDSFLDCLDEMEAEAPASDAGEALPPAVRRKTKSRSKSRKKGKKKRSQAKRSKITVANGLRCVLVGILLHVVAFLLGLIPLGVSVALVVLPITLAGTILAIIGQAMCLTAPAESETRYLIYGVLGLSSLGFCLRLAVLAVPLLGFLSLLTSVASLFLFVYALKRLAEFIGSANGEMHAEWILYWGGGLFTVRYFLSGLYGRLGEAMLGPLSAILLIVTFVIGALILGRYIDLLGCLKDELDGDEFDAPPPPRRR